jgi:hypothetical protein
MKKLLLAAAIAMIVISPALAGGDSDFDRCKGCRAGDRLRLLTRGRGGSRQASLFVVWSKSGSGRAGATRFTRRVKSAAER